MYIYTEMPLKERGPKQMPALPIFNGGAGFAIIENNVCVFVMYLFFPNRIPSCKIISLYGQDCEERNLGLWVIP